MPTITKLREELDFLSGQLSDRARWLAAGVIASGWPLVLATKSDKPIVLATILIAVILAIVSLSFDFLQYYVSYFYNRKLEQVAQRVVEKRADYKDNPSKLRTARFFFFHTKAWAGLAAAIVLLGSQGFVVFQKITQPELADTSSVSLSIGKKSPSESQK